MKIFISWSGTKSLEVATLFSQWIVSVIQSVDPWISSKDIEAGDQWFQVIQNELSVSNYGLLFMTEENKSAPWIMYEAGSLAKGLTKSRVCPLLIDLDGTQLTDPLTSFNYQKLDKIGTNKLVKNINRNDIRPIADTILERGFEKFWPEFESALVEINKVYISKPQKIKEPDEIMLELLEMVRKVDRKLNMIGPPISPPSVTPSVSRSIPGTHGTLYDSYSSSGINRLNGLISLSNQIALLISEGNSKAIIQDVYDKFNITLSKLDNTSLSTSILKLIEDTGSMVRQYLIRDEF